MKRKKIIAFVTTVAVLLCSLMPIIAVGADDEATEEAVASTYEYTFDLVVTNPCNSNDMDKDAVNVLYFQFYYTDLNGFGKGESYKYDMSWNGSQNKNTDFLKKHFIRSNDNAYVTSFTMSLPGKLSRTHIKLNMDGGERLAFTVNTVECNGIRINSNTDYVSSVYSDSEADIYCSMEASIISTKYSPYFNESGKEALTQTEFNAVIANSESNNQFKDQFNAFIDSSVLAKCVSSADSDINQLLSHSDEESMYCYTFYVTVENPLNLSDADYDEIETFYFDFTYKSANGYGAEKTYRIDMAYNESMGRNLNQNYLSLFESYDDDEYQTTFNVWIPGLLTKFDCCLNMSGERLSVDFYRITLNGLNVNTKTDYVSSAYYDSDFEIPCYVPDSCIVVNGVEQANVLAMLQVADKSTLIDQYGAVVGDKLLNLASSSPEIYVYHYFNLSK